MQSNLFSFDPSATDAPLDRGRHEVEVIGAEARTSRAGNPMLEITYRATTRQGDVFLKDYLVATPRSRWKIKNFCSAAGLEFDSGKIDPAALVGRRLAVEVGVEEDGQGNDRNVVSDYVGPVAAGAPGRPMMTDERAQPAASAGAGRRRAHAAAQGEEGIPF